MLKTKKLLKRKRLLKTRRVLRRKRALKTKQLRKKKTKNKYIRGGSTTRGSTTNKPHPGTRTLVETTGKSYNLASRNDPRDRLVFSGLTNEQDKFVNAIKQTWKYGMQSLLKAKASQSDRKVDRKTLRETLRSAAEGRRQQGRQQGGQHDGGILVDAETAFTEFIKNSTVEGIYNNSYSAIVIVYKYNGDISPYTSYNTQSIKDQKIGNVKRLCIKLVKINDSLSEYNFPTRTPTCAPPGFNYPKIKRTEKFSNFIDEMGVQININLKTANHYEPAAPYITYFSKDQTYIKELVYNAFTNFIYRKNGLKPDEEDSLKELANDFNTLGKTHEYPEYETAIIAMEFVENAESAKAITNPLYDKTKRYFIINLILYEFLRVVALTGYIHNDLHLGNVFFSENYHNYLDKSVSVSLPKHPVLSLPKYPSLSLPKYPSHSLPEYSMIRITLIDWGEYLQLTEEQIRETLDQWNIIHNDEPKKSEKIHNKAWETIISIVFKKTSNMRNQLNWIKDILGMEYTSADGFRVSYANPKKVEKDKTKAIITILNQIADSRKKQIDIDQKIINKLEHNIFPKHDDFRRADFQIKVNSNPLLETLGKAKKELIDFFSVLFDKTGTQGI